MNTRLTLRLCAVLFVLVSGSRMLAQSARAMESMSHRMMTLDIMYRNAEEASEREARAARQPQSLSATHFDTDRDGKLNDKEFAAWTAMLRKAATRTPEAMKRFDTDKDGKLSDGEWNAAVDELFGTR